LNLNLTDASTDVNRGTSQRLDLERPIQRTIDEFGRNLDRENGRHLELTVAVRDHRVAGVPVAFVRDERAGVVAVDGLEVENCNPRCLRFRGRTAIRA
jgi:hypothetical protein